MKAAPNLPFKIRGFPARRCLFPTEPAYINFPRGKFVPCLWGKTVFSPKQIRRILPLFFFVFHFIFFFIYCGRAGKLHPLKTYFVCTRLPNFKAQFTRKISTIIQALGRAFPSSLFIPSLKTQYGTCVSSVRFVGAYFVLYDYCFPYLPN